MSASTSPSTTDSSTLTTPGSYASSPRVAKRGRELQGEKISKKRKKVIGRPKNDWTPSRRRKLVRLYLMTNLEPKEIARVLRDGSFSPWYGFISHILTWRLIRRVLVYGTSKTSSQLSYKPDPT